MQIPEDVWEKLASEARRGAALSARLALPSTDSRVVAAMDGEGRRHLLIALATEDDGLDDSQTRGISIVTRTLVGLHEIEGRFIDLLCADGSGHAALDIIGGEIAERLAAGLETPKECVFRVVSKWRRFWGNAPKTLLSRDAQVGLIAELWFLLFWLIPQKGANSVLSWRGPTGSRHDFEGLSHSVEAKGTTSTRGLIHHINGISQLNPPEKGDLMLFSLRIREERGAGNTLPGLIAAGRTLLANEPALLDHFEFMLQSAGYSPLHDSDYDRIRWRVVEELLFRVADDFPKITPDSFRANVPPGIEAVTYEINLSGYLHLCIAKSPSVPFTF